MMDPRYALGEADVPLREFTEQPWQLWARWLYLAFLASFGLMMVAYGVVLLRAIYLAWNGAWEPELLAALCGGAFALLAGFMLTRGSLAKIRAAWQLRGLRVLAGPEALQRITKDRTDVLHWEEMQAVRMHLKIGKHRGDLAPPCQIIVRMKSELVFSFADEIPAIAELGRLIMEQTLPHLLPLTQAAMKRGETVTFGTLKASSLGLCHGDRRACWKDVKEMRVDKHGQLVIDTKGFGTCWLRRPLGEIDNYHVLTAVFLAMDFSRESH
jgi:hypothetical protein